MHIPHRYAFVDALTTSYIYQPLSVMHLVLRAQCIIMDSDSEEFDADLERAAERQRKKKYIILYAMHTPFLCASVPLQSTLKFYSCVLIIMPGRRQRLMVHLCLLLSLILVVTIWWTMRKHGSWRNLENCGTV